jgi:peroxiredoxin
MRSFILLSLIAASAASPGDKNELTPPAIGAKVGNFTLASTSGQQISLHRFLGKKATVVVFISVECPIANLYTPMLGDMQKTYGFRGVHFLAINSNDQDSSSAVGIHAREHKLAFPVCKDVDHKAADAFGARRTPEAFLLDSKGIIRYRGRIDDQFGYTYRRPAPLHTDLKDALEAVIAGRAVLNPETEVRGCIIGRDNK